MAVRVRFAPSPTGSLHLGSALTAVANWLFARRYDGSLLLRIDDTDETRAVEGAQDAIERDLRWLGLNWDEGPLLQSERRARHLEAAAAAQGAVDRDGARWLEAPGIQSFVIVRADGRPTYRWASAVDDADLGITHVIRGNDHLPNVELQQAAIRSLGAEPPAFLHHALVRGEEGKLSKREGAATIAGLREAGYPPEAVVNLLALVATSGPGDVLSAQQLVDRFDETRLARGEVTLEQSRLRALSTAHLALLPQDDLVERVAAFAPAGTDRGLIAALAPALRGAHTLAEAAELVSCVAAAPEQQHPLPQLAEIRERYPDRLSEQDARRLVDERRSSGVRLRDARVALTGRERGPELWAVLAALPRDEAIRRAA